MTQGRSCLRAPEGWISDAFAPQGGIGVCTLLHKLYAESRGLELQDHSEITAREIIQAFYANKGDEVVDVRPLHELHFNYHFPPVTDWDTMTGIPQTSRVFGYDILLQLARGSNSASHSD